MQTSIAASLKKRAIYAMIFTIMEDQTTNNLFHNLPAGPNPPNKVFCVVEIPRGKSNKYEYNKDLGVFKLDRALYSSVFYPTEYGFIPQTFSKEDGDPLDIMVLSTFTTFPGCLLTTNPIGMLEVIDSGKKDSKIIAIPSNDPRFEEMDKLSKISDHVKKEIESFWETYAALQPEKEINVGSWGQAKKAKKLIREAQEEYHKRFPTREK